MKKNILQLIVFALVLMTASTVFAKKSPDQVRAKLDEMSVQVLDRMYQKISVSRRGSGKCLCLLHNQCFRC